MEGVSPFFMEHHLQTTVIFLGDSHAILNQNSVSVNYDFQISPCCLSISYCLSLLFALFLS